MEPKPPVAPLADVLVECQAAYEKMTPGKLRVWGPFPHAGIYVYPPGVDDRHPTDEYPTCLARGTRQCQHDVAEDHDIAGIVTLVNAFPRLRAELERLQQEIQCRRLGKRCHCCERAERTEAALQAYYEDCSGRCHNFCNMCREARAALGDPNG